MRRCDWAGNDELMVRYHDTEWGVPKRDDGGCSSPWYLMAHRPD